MDLAKELKFERIIFYSDVLGLVDCVNEVDFNAALDPIIKDCNNLLSSFGDASLLNLSRNFNSDAHHMVGVGKSVGFRTWFGHILTFEDIDVCLASLTSSAHFFSNLTCLMY